VGAKRFLPVHRVDTGDRERRRAREGHVVGELLEHRLDVATVSGGRPPCGEVVRLFKRLDHRCCSSERRTG
jgi:hypothetical protein